MSATIAAACGCASTLLFHSLRIHAFNGAVPHVMLVVDDHPCVQQKVLVEGYRRMLEHYNATGATENSELITEAPVDVQRLLIPLDPHAKTPSGAAGLSADHTRPRISYSVIPFVPEDFIPSMQLLQDFLRHCGEEAAAAASPAAPSAAAGGEEGPSGRWSAEYFERCYARLAPCLQQLQPPVAEDGDGGSCASLRRGPPRELLGFVLLQRSAFQNDLKRYRLRLGLFDMGMRVVEHCHLESMSVAADALAAEGRLREALEDDQVYSYARSCAFSPAVAVSLGRAMADAVDLLAWRRGAAEPVAPLLPPPSYATALQDETIWSLFRRGALSWRASAAGEVQSTLTPDAFDAALRQPVVGLGEPLRIVCRDPTKVLTFAGGLEDCLMNTGDYPAAADADRNDVYHHRARFASAAPAAEKDAQPAEKEVHGRLRKKDYLALLKATGQKPNKRQHDHDEADGAASVPRGASMSSSIGGTFPMGEVITEAFDLSSLSGVCNVFAYPDPLKQVAMNPGGPFEMVIEGGVVTHLGPNAAADIVDLVSLVRQTEGACYVRELGIGLNPFVGLNHRLSDVTSFERQWGVHLSLGQRHPLFVKQPQKRSADGTAAESIVVQGPVLRRKAGRYHIDVFVDAASLSIGPFNVDFTKGLVTA